MKPRIRIFTCPRCGDQRITTLKDFGEVPDLLPCSQCDQLAIGDGNISDQTRIPRWEWFRPRTGQLGRLEPRVREYVRSGGLLLRPIAIPKDQQPTENRYQRRRQAAQKRRA